jgi:hypothetical protein
LHVFPGYTQGLSGHLGKNSVRSLANFSFSKLYLNAAVLVHNYTAGRNLDRVGPNCRCVPEKAHPYSPANRAALVFIEFTLFIPFDESFTFFHTLPERIEVIFVAGNFINETDGHHV